MKRLTKKNANTTIYCSAECEDVPFLQPFHFIDNKRCTLFYSYVCELNGVVLPASKKEKKKKNEEDIMW